MRAAAKPAIPADQVLHDCLAGMEDGPSKKRSASFSHEVGTKQGEYDQLASGNQLHSLPLAKVPATQVVIRTATKSDLIKLYEQQMVPARKPARVHYDLLLVSQPRCPYCNLGHSSTLDHFLPKSRFPQYSIIPENLVPSCRDCQFKKGRYVASTQENQTLHPYYDHGNYIKDQWVHAECTHSLPVIASFKAQPPGHWSLVDQQRATAHFKAHDLARRFAVEASTELAYLSYYYAEARTSGNHGFIAEGLSRSATAHSSIIPNSWQAALYRALSQDDWYIHAASA